MNFNFGSFNNWGHLKKVAVRDVEAAFASDARIEIHLRLILNMKASRSCDCSTSVWPCSPQKCGMSMAAMGSVAMTVSTWPDGIASSRFLALRTGRGHSRPETSSVDSA